MENITSYLTFTLDGELYASPVNRVINILEMCQITKVPLAPDHMVGVINLRGSVLPLIDTRIKFDLPATEFTPNTCILVLDIEFEKETILVGALVDSVQEVIEIQESQMQPPPNLGTKFKTDNITNVANINSKFIMILDMDRVFSVNDIVPVTADAV